MRYERKFIVEENFNNIIKYFLYENKFSIQYPPRVVNSIYYDSDNFVSYIDSEEGISNRSKCRIRFYNSDLENLILEYKVKKSDLGWKKSNYIYYKNQEYKYKDIILNNSNNKKLILPIPIQINFLDSPTLYVSYLRYYYISGDGNIRITIDSNLIFGKMRIGNLIIKNVNTLNANLGVLEIKYGIESQNLKIIELISTKYGLNISRFSKYCLGINACY